MVLKKINFFFYSLEIFNKLSFYFKFIFFKRLNKTSSLFFINQSFVIRKNLDSFFFFYYLSICVFNIRFNFNSNFLQPLFKYFIFKDKNDSSFNKKIDFIFKTENFSSSNNKNTVFSDFNIFKKNFSNMCTNNKNTKDNDEILFCKKFNKISNNNLIEKKKLILQEATLFEIEEARKNRKKIFSNIVENITTKISIDDIKRLNNNKIKTKNLEKNENIVDLQNNKLNTKNVGILENYTKPIKNNKYLDLNNNISLKSKDKNLFSNNNNKKKYSSINNEVNIFKNVKFKEIPSVSKKKIELTKIEFNSKKKISTTFGNNKRKPQLGFKKYTYTQDIRYNLISGSSIKKKYIYIDVKQKTTTFRLHSTLLQTIPSEGLINKSKENDLVKLVDPEDIVDIAALTKMYESIIIKPPVDFKKNIKTDNTVTNNNLNKINSKENILVSQNNNSKNIKPKTGGIRLEPIIDKRYKNNQYNLNKNNNFNNFISDKSLSFQKNNNILKLDNSVSQSKIISNSKYDKIGANIGDVSKVYPIYKELSINKSIDKKNPTTTYLNNSSLIDNNTTNFSKNTNKEVDKKNSSTICSNKDSLTNNNANFSENTNKGFDKKNSSTIYLNKDSLTNNNTNFSENTNKSIDKKNSTTTYLNNSSLINNNITNFSKNTNNSEKKVMRFALIEDRRKVNNKSKNNYNNKDNIEKK